MPASGDLKSVDSLLLTHPPNFKGPPSRQIDPAPNGNGLGQYLKSFMNYILNKFTTIN